jgi:hypothetical protein
VLRAAEETETTQENIHDWLELDEGDPGFQLLVFIVNLHEELHNLYSSPSIIRMIKQRRMKGAGHVTRMRRRGMHVGYLLESEKKRDH